MKVVVLVLVVIAALFAIVSGVWVAIALISAISRNRTEQTEQGKPEEQSTDPDI